MSGRMLSSSMLLPNLILLINMTSLTPTRFYRQLSSLLLVILRVACKFCFLWSSLTAGIVPTE